MTKFTFIYDYDNSIRMNIEAENVTEAYVKHQYEIDMLYQKGICLPSSSYWKPYSSSPWKYYQEGETQNG